MGQDKVRVRDAGHELHLAVYLAVESTKGGSYVVVEKCGSCKALVTRDDLAVHVEYHKGGQS